jgi:hypothetical protein
MSPNKPRGIPRVDDRRVLNGIFWSYGPAQGPAARGAGDEHSLQHVSVHGSRIGAAYPS